MLNSSRNCGPDLECGVADERFTTFVAFVDGADAASGGELLAGFREQLAVEYGVPGSSLSWSGLILRHVLPDHIESRTSVGDLNEEESRALNTEAFNRLLVHLASS